MSASLAEPAAGQAPRPKLDFVHLFRGGAIALVVLAHAKLAVAWPEPLTLAARMLRALIEGGDIPFFFIAGFVFQYSSRNFAYGPYLKSRLRFVVLPYLFCSLPVLLHAFVFRYGVFENAEARGALPVLADLAHSLLTAHHMFVPLWFIPTIVVLYLLAPVLLWIDRHPRAYAALPLALLAGATLHVSPLYEDVVRDAANVLPVYALGMAVCRYRTAVFAVLRRAPLAWLALLLGLFAAEVALGSPGRFASLRPFSEEGGLVDFSYLQKTLLSLLALERLDRAGPALSAAKRRIEGVFVRLADLSFGIFFGHVYVLNFAVRPALSHFLRVPNASALSLLAIGVAYLSLTTGLVLVVKRMLAENSRTLIGC
jgi:surface polysaccharide O-acyltransferase-like enzyme